MKLKECTAPRCCNDHYFRSPLLTKYLVVVRILLSPFSLPFLLPSPFPLLFLLVSLFFPSFSSPSFAFHPLTSYLSSPCSPPSSGVAGPAAPGVFSCLQLSLRCLPVGRHQEGAAGSCKTWGAREVSALITSLIPIFHFLIHRAHSLRLQVSE